MSVYNSVKQRNNSISFTSNSHISDVRNNPATTKNDFPSDEKYQNVSHYQRGNSKRKNIEKNNSHSVSAAKKWSLSSFHNMMGRYHEDAHARALEINSFKSQMVKANTKYRSASDKLTKWYSYFIHPVCAWKKNIANGEIKTAEAKLKKAEQDLCDYTDALKNKYKPLFNNKISADSAEFMSWLAAIDMGRMKDRQSLENGLNTIQRTDHILNNFSGKIPDEKINKIGNLLASKKSQLEAQLKIGKFPST